MHKKLNMTVLGNKSRNVSPAHYPNTYLHKLFILNTTLFLKTRPNSKHNNQVYFLRSVVEQVRRMQSYDTTFNLKCMTIQRKECKQASYRLDLAKAIV